MDSCVVKTCFRLLPENLCTFRPLFAWHSTRRETHVYKVTQQNSLPVLSLTKLQLFVEFNVIFLAFNKLPDEKFNLYNLQLTNFQASRAFMMKVCFVKHDTMIYVGGGIWALLSPSLFSRWTCIVSLTPQSLYPPQRRHRYYFYMIQIKY